MAENHIIKKKVEEWIHAAECLKKGIHAYEEEVDVFYDLFYVPGTDTVAKNYVEERCILLGKLGNDISSKEPVLAAEINKFEGICSIYFNDSEKFKAFREELKKNSIFKEILNRQDREKKKEEEFKRQQQEELKRRKQQKEKEEKQKRQQEEELIRQRKKREAEERRAREEAERKKKLRKAAVWIIVILFLACGAYFIIPTSTDESKEEMVQTKPVEHPGAETGTIQAVKEQPVKKPTVSKAQEQSSSQTQTISSPATKPATKQPTPATQARQQTQATDVKPSTNQQQVTTSMPATVEPAVQVAETPASLYDAGLTAYKQFKYEQAHTYFSKAASQGEINAQYYLGMMFLNGNGVQKNSETAFTYVSKAANKGHKDAIYQLAQMYDGGWGTAKDKDQAKFWYKKAADQGNAAARRRLNNM